jgi:hypothetical protein
MHSSLNQHRVNSILKEWPDVVRYRGCLVIQHSLQATKFLQATILY